MTAMLGNSDGIYTNPRCPGKTGPCMVCPSDNCVLANPISLFVDVCDADFDSVTVDLEVVSLGSKFSKMPTETVSGQVGKPQSAYCLEGGDCSCFQVQFGDVKRAASYEFAVRIMDEHGAPGLFRYPGDGPIPSDGWVHLSSWQVKTTP